MLKFIKGFGYAFSGLVIFFRNETNGKVQLLAAFVAVLLGWILKLSGNEWIVIIGCIAAVLSLEMMNTAIEKLCNHVQPDIHPAIKTIKDIAAGAVLWMAIASAFIGCIIFIPKILLLL